MPFTPLENHAVPFSANTEFNAPCELSRYKIEDFLTVFVTNCNITILWTPVKGDFSEPR